jgi:GntR family transcriptional repressor for pyruvate dehydrogenase complex
MNSIFEKVRKKKAYVEIVEQIQNLIKEGRLKKDDKLPPERVLAEQLGVSRVPLREALAALEILGVIESKGGRGNFIVNAFDSAHYVQQFKELEQGESPLELLEARKVMEVEIAGFAAKRHSPEEIHKLESIVGKMEKVVHDVSEFMELNRRFHLGIAVAANNSVLYQMMRYIVNELNKQLWIKLDEKTLVLPGRTNKYFHQHRKILEAIKAKNEIKARNATLHHLVSFETDLLGENGVFNHSLLEKQDLIHLKKQSG